MPQPKCLFRFRFATCILPWERIRIRMPVTVGSVPGTRGVPMPAVAGLRRWCPEAGRRRCRASADRGRWCSRGRQASCRSLAAFSAATAARACESDRQRRHRAVSERGWRSGRAGNRWPTLFPRPTPRLEPDSPVQAQVPLPLQVVVQRALATERGGPFQSPVAVPRRRVMSWAPDEARRAVGWVEGARSNAPAAMADPRAHRRSGGVCATTPRSPPHGSSRRSWPRRRGSGFPLTSCHLRILCAESAAPEMNPQLCRRFATARRFTATVRGVAGEGALGPCVEGATAARTRRGTRHRTGPRRHRRRSLSPVQRRAGDENGHPSVIIRARPLPCRPWTR